MEQAVRITQAFERLVQAQLRARLLHPAVGVINAEHGNRHASQHDVGGIWGKSRADERHRNTAQQHQHAAHRGHVGKPGAAAYFLAVDVTLHGMAARRR